MTALPARTGPGIDDVDARLIDRLHARFPLVDRPFVPIADELGLNEDELLERLRRLLSRGVLARFGPLFQIDRAGGCFTLAAMQVPASRWDMVAAQVNDRPEVAHSYRRDHHFNLWFVLAGETSASVDVAQAEIERASGLRVLRLPRQRAYGAEQAADQAADHAAPRQGSPGLSAFDRRLVLAMQSGLAPVSRPFEAVAALLDIDGATVRERLAVWLGTGLVRRIGVLPNHYRLGYSANGMSVWDVADDQVDSLGPRVAALPGVSHCNRRPRRAPDWPFNLIVMLRGRSREDVAQHLKAVRTLLAPASLGDDMLYSTAILKKTGLRLSQNT